LVELVGRRNQYSSYTSKPYIRDMMRLDKTTSILNQGSKKMKEKRQQVGLEKGRLDRLDLMNGDVAKPATGEIYRTRIISKEQWRDGLTSA